MDFFLIPLPLQTQGNLFMKIAKTNKLCIIALQNLEHITGNHINLDMKTLSYTEKNNIHILFMVHL